MANGFTLVETIVVLGLISIVTNLGLLASWNAYELMQFQQEKDLAITQLHLAQMNAMTNHNNMAASVTVSPHGLTVSNATVSFSSTLTASQNPFTFQQLNGNVDSPVELTLSRHNHHATITINTQGLIEN